MLDLTGGGSEVRAVPQTRRASRDAALVELQRLHAAILASRARRGVGPGAAAAAEAPSPEAIAARDLTRRLQASADARPTGVEPAARSAAAGGWRIAAAVVVAGAWAAMTLTHRREVVTEAGPSGRAPAPAAAPPRRGPAGAAPAVPAKAIRVTLETIRPVWLRITVDGARAHEGALPAGGKLAADGDRKCSSGRRRRRRARHHERRRSRAARPGWLAADGVDHAGGHQSADPDAARASRLAGGVREHGSQTTAA